MTSIFRQYPSLIPVFILIALSISGCVANPETRVEPVSGTSLSEKTEFSQADASALQAEIKRDIKTNRLDQALEKTEHLIKHYRQAPAFHLLKASIMKRQGKEQQALDYLTLQIRNQPDNIGLVVARGQFLLENGYIESARSDFLTAYKKNHRSLEILKVLIAIEKQNGNIKGSLELTKEALKLDEKDHDLWFNRAQLELRSNQLRQARTSIERAIQLSDRSLKYRQLHLEILGYLKDGAEIKRQVRLLFQQFPKSDWVSIRYATLLYTTNERLKAKEVLKKAIETHPRNYLLHFQLATMYAAEKKWDASIQMFMAGLKEKPDSAWAMVQLSKVYFQSGEVGQAVKYLQQARSSKSRDPFVYETLAKFYNQQSDTFEAEDIILEGLAINRKNQNLILEYANLLEKRANYKEAIKAYEKALTNSPEDHFILGKLGNLHRLISNYERSKTYFLQSIQKKSDTSWVRSYYVELLTDTEDWESALIEIDRILEITPDDYWSYAKKAQIENQLEMFENANRSIKQAIALRPDAPLLREIEGNSLERLKRYKAAEQSFQTALGETPDNAYLLTRLAYVQLHLNRKAALANVEKALDNEDFDIGTIELYLYLTGKSRQYWQFQKNSVEEQVHTAIMLRQFDRAEQLLQSPSLDNSPHAPYLSALSLLLKKEGRTVLSESAASSPAKSDWHYFYRGLDAMRKKNWQASKQLFQKGLTLNKHNTWLMIKLAYVHQQLQEYQPAIELLEKYLAKRESGSNTWVKLRLALNFDLSKNYKNAENVYQNILKANPRDNVALNNLAWMYLTANTSEMHKVDEALKLALQAVKISPSPANLDTLAEAYYQKKEYHKALKTVEQALDRDRKGLDDFKKTKKKILKAIQSVKED